MRDKKPEVKKLRIKKIHEKYLEMKQNQKKDQGKGLDYGSGICAPVAKEKKKDSGNQNVPVCKHCGLPGHQRRSHKDCKENKKNKGKKNTNMYICVHFL